MNRPERGLYRGKRAWGASGDGVLGRERLTTRPNQTMPLPFPDRTALLAHLAARGYDTETHDHPAVFTVAESSELHRAMKGGHTKNLFLRDRKGNHFLVTAEQDTDVDLKRLHKVIGGASRFSFGKPEEMMAWLGVSPGSVTALAIGNDVDGHVRFVVDERLLRHEHVNCHPLTNEATTTIRRDHLLAFAREHGHDPLVADLTGAGLPGTGLLGAGLDG